MKRSRLVENAVRQDATEAEFLGSREEIRRLQLKMARILRRIERTGHFVFRGCSSIAQFGELHGMSGREARMLAAVGRALELRPELKQGILAGELSLDAAASLRKLFEDPGLIRAGEDWLAWAKEWPARELERRIRSRILEARTGEPSSTLTAILTASGREKFERARQLASRKTNSFLSEGQTVEVLSDHYLDSFDTMRKKPRRRRMADTSGRPGRNVPAEVERAILARQGDRCAVPGCDHSIWMNKAHLHPHRHGGSREADNLLYLCWRHHELLDRGLLLLSGTPDHPVFASAEGQAVGSRPRSREIPRAPP